MLVIDHQLVFMSIQNILEREETVEVSKEFFESLKEFFVNSNFPAKLCEDTEKSWEEFNNDWKNNKKNNSIYRFYDVHFYKIEGNCPFALSVNEIAYEWARNNLPPDSKKVVYTRKDYSKWNRTQVNNDAETAKNRDEFLNGYKFIEGFYDKNGEPFANEEYLYRIDLNYEIDIDIIKVALDRIAPTNTIKTNNSYPFICKDLSEKFFRDQTVLSDGDFEESSYFEAFEYIKKFNSRLVGQILDLEKKFSKYYKFLCLTLNASDPLGSIYKIHYIWTAGNDDNNDFGEDYGENPRKQQHR